MGIFELSPMGIFVVLVFPECIVVIFCVASSGLCSPTLGPGTVF